MSSHEIKAIIETADRAITNEDFDALMDIYAEDATLLVKPGLAVRGKAAIRQAFVAIAEHFHHALSVSQGRMEVIEGGDTALVVMETLLTIGASEDAKGPAVRRATYVFRKDAEGQWLCVIDNSYGTELLDAAP
ncbi:MAG: SgcJ/EcaC family oxidoreductase [Bradyrhizobium sp.]|nr:SgcJ/EcaC family oxidoreductase [Bradyrhizobium sp.]